MKAALKLEEMRKQELEEESMKEKLNEEKVEENTVKELFTSILNEEKDTVRKLKNQLDEKHEKRAFNSEDNSTAKIETKPLKE